MPPSPRVFVFRPKSAVERAARAARLDLIRDQIFALSDDEISFRDKTAALRLISRSRDAFVTSSTFGQFTMLANAQVSRVWDAIEALPASARPRDVDRVFKRVLVNLAPGEGRVTLSREDLAEQTGLLSGEVSKALSVLVRLGVLRRELHREDGLRGPGRAVFFINPHVGWNGPLELQAKAAEGRSPPLLQLMEGGSRKARRPSLSVV